MIRLAATLFVATLTATGAAQPAAAPARSAIEAGTYDLEIVFNGGTVEGTLELTRRQDSLAVVLHVSDHLSPVAVSGQQGNRLILTSTAPGLAIRYELDFAGDAVTGTFTYDGQDGRVSGRRRSGR